MPERVRMKPVMPHQGRRKGRDRQAAVSLAVYHAGDGAEKHLSRLRSAGRFRLAYFSPRRSMTAHALTAFDGVLWELSPEHQPERRHVAAIACRVPVVSYSAGGGRGVIDLSRRLGFTTHLKAPLSPTVVQGQLARAKGMDLFARIRATQRTLRGRLAGREALVDLVRAVNSTLDPKKIADALLDR